MRRSRASCKRNAHEHAGSNFAQSRNIRMRGAFPTLSLRRRLGIFGRNRFKRDGRRERGANGIAKIGGGVIRATCANIDAPRRCLLVLPEKKSHTKLCGFFNHRTIARFRRGTSTRLRRRVLRPRTLCLIALPFVRKHADF